MQDLVNFLETKVKKQWCDFPRNQLSFIKRLKQGEQASCAYTGDFDQHGVIYWIGTNGLTTPEWVNPSKTALIFVTTSRGRKVLLRKRVALMNSSAA